MKIEEITAVIRPRAPWEAVDLGFALARHHLPRLLSLWLALVIPWWVLIVLLFGAQFWSFVLVWFFKPFYDWLVVFYLGRALFGVRPAWREILRETPRPVLRHAFDLLILRRLSLYRSLLLPVRVLEGQKGGAYAKRASVITSHGGGTAFSLLACSGLFEVLAAVGVSALVYTLLPDMMKPDMAEVGEMMLGDALKDPHSPLRWVLLLSYLAAIPFVEIFYVGGGFGLYLNTRTHMEGWDIDLAFRRIAARLDLGAGKDPARGSSLSGIPAWVIALLSLGLLMGGAHAQAPQQEPPGKDGESPSAVADESPAPSEGSKEPIPDAVPEPGETPEETIGRVVAHPDFKVHKKKVTYYRTNRIDPQFGGGLMQIFGVIFQAFVWIVAAALVGLLVYWIVRHLYLFKGRPRGKKELELSRRAEVVMGMDIRPEALPADIPATAWRWWSEGKVRESVGLLYRGTLSRLVSEVSLPIEESDTEGECLARADRAGELASPRYVADLTSAWVGVAYGTSPPIEERMRRLCESWPFRQPVASKALPGGGSA